MPQYTYTPEKLKKRAAQSRDWRRRNSERVKEYRKLYRPTANANERKRYHKNIAKFRRIAVEWYWKNREKVLASCRERRIKNIENFRAKSREYDRKNPEKTRKWRKKYEAQNKQKVYATSSRWKRNNRKACRRYEKNWIAKNKERHRTNQRRYETKLRGAPGYHTHEQWIARVEFYGWRCVYCKKELNRKTVTQDHIIPISKGGTDWASNLAPACHSCNCSKSAKIVHRRAA